MALVPDASVALKWFLEEDASDRAQALLDEPLVAPDFLRLECSNVLAVHREFGDRSTIPARLLKQPARLH